jgi:hypothetical protein
VRHLLCQPHGRQATVETAAELIPTTPLNLVSIPQQGLGFAAVQAELPTPVASRQKRNRAYRDALPTLAVSNQLSSEAERSCGSSPGQPAVDGYRRARTAVAGEKPEKSTAGGVRGGELHGVSTPDGSLAAAAVGSTPIACRNSPSPSSVPPMCGPTHDPFACQCTARCECFERHGG